MAAEARHDQVGREEGHEHSRQDGDLHEGDDVGGDEETALADKAADLLTGPRLDGVEVVVKAGTDLAGVLVVEEAGLLPQQVPEVPLAQAVGQALRLDVPAHVVQVYQDELHGCYPGELCDRGIDGLLVLQGIVVAAAVGLDTACGRVEIIQELTEQDAHQWERNAGSDGKYRAGAQKKEVEPCRLRAEQESEPGEKLPFCLHCKSQNDERTAYSFLSLSSAKLHEDYIRDNLSTERGNHTAISRYSPEASSQRLCHQPCYRLILALQVWLNGFTVIDFSYLSRLQYEKIQRHESRVANAF